MTDDLVKRLRDGHIKIKALADALKFPFEDSYLLEAADALERLSQQQAEPELKAELEDQTKWAGHYARRASDLFDALLAIEQAYSNPHSPQHRAACLAEARTVLASFDARPSAASQPARPVAFLGALLDEYLRAGHEAYKLGRETERVSKARRAIVAAFHASQPAQEPEAWRDALEDCHGALVYIRSVHGDLYGVGWDRCMDKAVKALAAPPADDEAVRLLRELRELVESECPSMLAYERGGDSELGTAIDAYLAKVNK
jgi:hypothetical protein